MNWGQALMLVMEKKGDVKPSALFLWQIEAWSRKKIGDGENVGWEGDEKVDPLVGFWRRLQARKGGGLTEDEEFEKDRE
jgi:hypothetical protein